MRSVFYFFFAAILAFSAVNAAPRGLIDDKIKNAINKIFDDLRENGIPTLNITSLDPLIYPELNIAYDNDTLATVALNLSDVNVNGLTQHEFERLKFTLIKMHLDFSIKWPKVEGKCLYDLLANIYVMPMDPWYGSGPFNFLAEGFTVSGEGHLKLEGLTHAQFTSLSLSFGIGNFNATVEGFMNDQIFSQTVSKALSAAVPNLLDEFKQEITDFISPIAMTKINEVLKNTPITYLAKYFRFTRKFNDFQTYEV